MLVSLCSSALDHSLPSFLTACELQPSANAPFRPPSKGRGLGDRRVFNALEKPKMALAQEELPELPTRWYKDASILKELAIDLDDPAICDRGTWRMAVVERIDVSLDDRTMRLLLVDASSHCCAIDKGPDGKASELGQELDDLLEIIYDDYLGLRHSYQSELVDLVGDIEMDMLEPQDDPDAAFMGDLDYEDATILNMRAELLSTRRMTRKKLFEMYRRFILPYLHQILPQNFLLWALKSAHEKAQARFEGLSRHLANVFLGHLIPSESDGARDLHLWARAIRHVTSAAPMPEEEEEGAPLLVLGKRSREDSEESLPQSEEAFSWDRMDVDEDDKVSTSSAEEDDDISFWTEMNTHIANEILLSYCEEPDITDPLLHPPCLVPPDEKEDIDDVFGDHDKKTRHTVKQAHVRLLDQFDKVSELRCALEQAKADEEKREDAMAPAPQEPKPEWSHIEFRVSLLTGRTINVRHRVHPKPKGGGVKEASSPVSRRLLPVKQKQKTKPAPTKKAAASLKTDSQPAKKKPRRSKSEPIRISSDDLLDPRPPFEDRGNSRALARQAPLVMSSPPPFPLSYEGALEVFRITNNR